MAKSITSSLKALLQATRPRTFPLAIASIVCGNGLALSQIASSSSLDWHNITVFLLTLWVALALQILSNLANDYGDGVKGTDNLRDINSPERMIAQGLLRPEQLKRLIIGWATITFFSGVALISIGFDNLRDFLIFLEFGIIAIIAAMAYTMGKRPYGYRAMGEVAVLVFFGWLAVLGSIYLQTGQVELSHLLPATGCGGLAACVLYVNNMRDIYSDKQAGKITLAVLLGGKRMRVGYTVLMALSILCYLLYGVIYNFYSLLWVLALPLMVKHLSVIYSVRPISVSSYSTISTMNSKIDTVLIGSQLKSIVKLTLIVNLLFVLGLGISHLFHS